jgi:serine/threonine protein kinase
MKALGKGSHGSVYKMDQFINSLKPNDIKSFCFFDCSHIITYETITRDNDNNVTDFLAQLMGYIKPFQPKDFIVKTSSTKDFMEEKDFNIKAISILGSEHSLLHNLIGFSITSLSGIEKFYICNMKGTPIFEKSLDVTELKKYCSDILYGLTLLSKHGLSHNDVKIENTMYNSLQKKYVLIDFGKLNDNSKLKPDNLCGFNRDYRLFKLFNMGVLAVRMCKYEALKQSKKKHKQLGTQWYIEVYKTEFWLIWKQYIKDEYTTFENELKTQSTTSSNSLKKQILKYSDLYMFGVSIIYLLCKYNKTLSKEDYTFFTHLAISLTVNNKNLKPPITQSFPRILIAVKSFTFETLPVTFQLFYMNSNSSNKIRSKTSKKR